MADSVSIDKSSKSADLDDMLNEAEALMEEAQEIDDEDVMDRLIMEDVFDVAEEELAKQDEEDNISEDELPEKSESALTDAVDEVDQTIDSPQTQTKPIEGEEMAQANDESDVDSILDSAVEQQESDQIDEFAEDDLLVDDQPESEEPGLSNEQVSDAEATNQSEPDPGQVEEELLEDFDISADDNSSDEDEIVNEEPIESVETSSVESDTVSVEVSDAIEKTNEAINTLNSQVEQLWSENERLKTQVSKIPEEGQDNDDSSPLMGEVEALKKDQAQLKKAIKENQAQVPILTYVALGVAGVALLVGGGLGFVGYSAKSDVAELSELVGTLEEEAEILSQNQSKTDIDKLAQNVGLLKDQDEHINGQLDEINLRLERSTLKKEVASLIEQNKTLQQEIAKMQKQVEDIATRKPQAVKTVEKKSVKKVVNKPVTQKWGVNLVSFKQGWYAKSKADEFKKKGVPADVLKVNIDGTDWYRLRVNHFRSKAEATNYANKVKKSLNLTSVWVTSQ